MQIIKTEWGYNGCGFSVISDYVPNFDFTDVCNSHDIATFEGGTLGKYLSINLGFYTDLIKVIMKKQRPWYKYIGLFLYATLLGLFVLSFNWLFFDWRLK